MRTLSRSGMRAGRRCALMLAVTGALLFLAIATPARVAAWCHGSDFFCDDQVEGRYTCGDNYTCKLAPGGGFASDGGSWECTCQLKGGIIAAIVISCVVFVCVVVGAGVCIYQRNLTRRLRAAQQEAQDAAIAAREQQLEQRLEANDPLAALQAAGMHLHAPIPAFGPGSPGWNAPGGGAYAPGQAPLMHYPPVPLGQQAMQLPGPGGVVHVQPQPQQQFAPYAYQQPLPQAQPYGGHQYAQQAQIAYAQAAYGQPIGPALGYAQRPQIAPLPPSSPPCGQCGRQLPPFDATRPFCASCGTRRADAAPVVYAWAGGGPPMHQHQQQQHQHQPPPPVATLDVPPPAYLAHGEGQPSAAAAPANPYAPEVWSTPRKR